jgi:hypothetical protein
MIKVTNGVRTTMVTKGAFKEIYELMGYKLWAPSDSPKEELSLDLEPKVEEPEIVEEEEFESEEPDRDVEVETPISEMKLEDLKDYAAQHDIDISKAKTKKEIKSIIRAEVAKRGE